VTGVEQIIEVEQMTDVEEADVAATGPISA